MKKLARSLILVFGVVVLFRMLEKRGISSHGRFLGVPYDFRMPTYERVKEAVWNTRDSRILRPHAFGWGYSLNLHALLRFFR